MKLMLTTVGIFAALYAAVCGYIYSTQDKQIFPADQMNVIEPHAPVEGEKALVYKTEDGAELHGRIYMPDNWDGDMIIGYPGNAHNPLGLVRFMHETFPTKMVVSYFYRSYGDSTGKPSKNNLQNDALTLFDHLKDTYEPKESYLVGASIGSSMAAHVARHREVDGVTLVVPIDSMVAMAQDRYPYLPVKPLLKHNFDTAGDILHTNAPTALIDSSIDGLVPESSRKRVMHAMPNLRYHYTSDKHDHGELLDTPSLGPWLKDALEALKMEQIGWAAFAG